MNPPLILEAANDLLFFKTAHHMEAYVQPVDLAKGQYGQSWDSEGRLLELRVEPHATLAFGLVRLPMERVTVRVTEERPSHRGDLHQALLRFLLALGVEGVMPITNDTSDILEFAIANSHWS